MTPKISVILPVHNRADVLARAIESVLAQSLNDFELVIVDDGSTDASVAVARGFDDPRIRLIELGQNRGGNAARNAGVEAAKAPLIAFLDSDDTYLAEKLECVVAEFEREPELELLVDSFIKVQPPGSTRARVSRRNPVIRDTALFRRALFTRVLWKATPSISVRRETILKVMFDESLRRLQDFDFLIRASEVANCAATDQLLWVKYWDPNSISIQDNLISANVELVRRHPEYLAVREYRPGLAYILRLTLWRRLKRAEFGAGVRDVKQLAKVFGWAEASRLLAEACLPRPSIS
jgi:glycosyltransferase involved in cell wall biosynthesis